MSKDKRLSRQENRQDIRNSIREKGFKVNLRNILGERGDRYFWKHHPEAAKWRNFRNSEPKEVSVQVYGSPIPLSYGTFRVKCDVIEATDLEPDALTDAQAFGGGGEQDTPFVEKYKASFAVKTCEGEQGALRRVWFNKELVYDFSHANDTGYVAHPNFANKLVFYPGSETQTADPTLEAIHGVGNVPAYRGTCYIVFKDIPLGRFGNELPEVEAEVSRTATPNHDTQDVADFATSAGFQQNFICARNSPTLYQFTPDLLSVVRRGPAVLHQTINIQDALDAIAGGCSVVGTITIDEVGGRRIDPVYFPCQDGTGAGFILRYDGDFTSSYDDRITGANLETCFINKGRLYVADGTGQKIRCYDKTTLALLWTRNGPVPGLTAGNFTVDNGGFVWLVWYDGGDPDSLYLSRLSHGGVVKNYTISISAGSASGIIYDTINNVFLTGGITGNKICRVSNTNPPVVVDTLASHTADNCGPLFTSQYQFSNSAYFCDGTSLYRIKTTTLAVRETTDLTQYADVGSGIESFGYGAIERALWICRDDLPNLSKLPLNRFDASGNNLDDTISDLCTKAGLESTELDVTEITGADVAGFIVPDRVPAKEPLEFLLTAYQVGVREHYESSYGTGGIKLEFVFRADQASIVTIPEEDLGIGDGAPEDQAFTEERFNEEDLPNRVNVRYADLRRDYDSHVQFASIPPEVTAATRQLNLDFPNLVLDDDQAKQLADVILACSEIEDTNCFFTLPLKYLYLEPEDLVTVTCSGVDRLIRIETVELGANYILEISGIVTSVDAYISTSTGSAAPAADNPVRVPVSSMCVLVDTSCVRDQDGTPEDAGLYIFAAPQQSGDDDWRCRVSRSKDGLVFAAIATFAEGSTIGVTMTALASGETTVFDEASDVGVRVLNGAFVTATEAQLHANPLLNLCAIGSEETGWELIQFADASAPALDGSISLQGMLRGRFGTEQYLGTHAVGELVCLFDFTNNTTRRAVLPLSDRNLESIYKVRTLGAPLSSAVAREFTNTARSLMPYSIREECITWAHNEPSANDWTVNFTRRSRIGFELQDFDDVAVNEESEEYEIDIRDTLTGDVVRTITVGPGLPATTGINLAIAANAVTRGAGSFLTDGFLVGQFVDLEGWATATNNYRFKISALSALSMTLDGTLTNEISGAGRTVNAATPAFCYTAAQQTADPPSFGTKGNFYATFYQISQRLRENDEVGRGFSTQIHIS